MLQIYIFFKTFAKAVLPPLFCMLQIYIYTHTRARALLSGIDGLCLVIVHNRTVACLKIVVTCVPNSDKNEENQDTSNYFHNCGATS